MTSNSASNHLALGRIGFIGAGRLARTLALAFARAGLEVVAVNSRRVESAQAMAELLAQDRGTPSLDRGMLAVTPLARPPAPRVWAHAQEVATQSDTVFITVPDDAIEPTCSALVWRGGQRVVHCSGATEVAALNAAAQAGAQVAGFHPLHTFGDVQTALAGLPGCAVAVEASEWDDAQEGSSLRQGLQALARAIGARPFELPPGSRALYHASAHYAGSLVVTLMDEAVRHWARFGVEQEQALEALLPLLRSTLAAMQAKASGSGAGTGSGIGSGSRLGAGMAGVVARGDAKTLGSHLSALEQLGADERELYAQVSRRSVRLALESGRISPAQARVMDLLLNGMLVVDPVNPRA